MSLSTPRYLSLFVHYQTSAAEWNPITVLPHAWSHWSGNSRFAYSLWRTAHHSWSSIILHFDLGCSSGLPPFAFACHVWRQALTGATRFHIRFSLTPPDSFTLIVWMNSTNNQSFVPSSTFRWHCHHSPLSSDRASRIKPQSYFMLHRNPIAPDQFVLQDLGAFGSPAHIRYSVAPTLMPFARVLAVMWRFRDLLILLGATCWRRRLQALASWQRSSLTLCWCRRRTAATWCAGQLLNSLASFKHLSFTPRGSHGLIAAQIVDYFRWTFQNVDSFLDLHQSSGEPAPIEQGYCILVQL